MWFYLFTLTWHLSLVCLCSPECPYQGENGQSREWNPAQDRTLCSQGSAEFFLHLPGHQQVWDHSWDAWIPKLGQQGRVSSPPLCLPWVQKNHNSQRQLSQNSPKCMRIPALCHSFPSARRIVRRQEKRNIFSGDTQVGIKGMSGDVELWSHRMGWVWKGP